MTVLLKKGKLALTDNRLNAHLITDAGNHAILLNRVAAELHRDYAELYNLWNDWMENIITDYLYIVLSTSPNTVERNVEKFNGWISGLYYIDKYSLPKEKPTAVIPKQDYPSGDKWGRNILFSIPSSWFASPISLDFLLTIIGLIPKMRLGETVEEFFTRIINSDASQATYFRKARNNGNLEAAINWKLPSQQREHTSDWLLHNPRRTLPNYYAAADCLLPASYENLYTLRIKQRLLEETYI